MGGLASCSPWGRKESDTRATELNWVILGKFFSLDQSMEVAATQKRVEDLEVIWTSLPSSFSRSWEAQPRSQVLAGQLSLS